MNSHKSYIYVYKRIWYFICTYNMYIYKQVYVHLRWNVIFIHIQVRLTPLREAPDVQEGPEFVVQPEGKGKSKVAAWRNTSLQHTATHCWKIAMQYCNTLQCTAMHYDMLHTLQHTQDKIFMLQYTATHCNTLQYIATHATDTQGRDKRKMQITSLYKNVIKQPLLYKASNL